MSPLSTTDGKHKSQDITCMSDQAGVSWTFYNPLIELDKKD